MLWFLRPIVVAVLVAGLIPARAAALGEPSFVTDTPVPGAAQLVAAGRAAPILVDADDTGTMRPSYLGPPESPRVERSGSTR